MERDCKNMHVETRIMCQLLPIFSLQNIRITNYWPQLQYHEPQADFRNRFIEDIFRNAIIFL